jgi:TPR repeat protein
VSQAASQAWAFCRDTAEAQERDLDVSFTQVFFNRKSAIALLGAAALSLYGCASRAPKPDPRGEYARGMSIIQQHQTAQGRAAGFIWIWRAAHQNLAVAQDRLGLMYLYGNGVEQNTSGALQWIHRAAERGAPAAQLQLGSLYSAGNCVPRNYVRAYYWLAIAAKPETSSVYIYNIGQVRDIAYKRARSVARALTAAQRATVDHRVAMWAPKPSVPYQGVVMVNRWSCSEAALRASQADQKGHSEQAAP